MIDSAQVGGRFAFARTLAITMGLVILPLFGLTFYWGYRADQNHVSRINRYLGEVELGMSNRVTAVKKMLPIGECRVDLNLKSAVGIPGVEFACKSKEEANAVRHQPIRRHGLYLQQDPADKQSQTAPAAEQPKLNCDLEIKAGHLDPMYCKSAKSEGASPTATQQSAARTNGEVATARIPWPSLLPKRVLESGIEQFLLADIGGQILAHSVPPNAPDERELRDKSPNPFMPIPVGLVRLPADLLGSRSDEAGPAKADSPSKAGLSFTKADQADLLSNPTLRINGQRYRLFVRAIALNLNPFDGETLQSGASAKGDIAEDKRDDPNVLYLVALERAGGFGPINFRLDAKARLSLVVLALVLLLALPLIKLLLTHASDGLGRWHARWLMLSVFGLAALVSILLCAWSRLESTHFMMRQTAQASAKSIANGLKSEVAEVSKTMLKYGRDYLGVNCPTKDETGNEQDQVGNGKYILNPESKLIHVTNEDYKHCSLLDSFEVPFPHPQNLNVSTCFNNIKPQKVIGDENSKQQLPAILNVFAAAKDGELTDKNGKMMVPVFYTLGTNSLPNSLNISDREYLKLSLWGEGAQLKDLTGASSNFGEQRIVVQRLRNLIDARLSTQIVTRCGSVLKGNGTSPRILSADVLLTSAERPVLPLNLQFSVFDLRTGTVLFHSDSERVLIEDVFRELDDDQLLAAAARVREPDAFWADYRGDRSWVAFEPIVALNWGVIVYAPREPVDALLYAIVCAAIGLSLLGLLLLTGWLQAWLWASKMRGAALFWPQWRLRRIYLAFALLLALIASVSGFWAEKTPEPALALLGLSLLTLHCLLVALSPQSILGEGKKPYFGLLSGVAALLGLVIWTLCNAQGNLAAQVFNLLLIALPLVAMLLLGAQDWLNGTEWVPPTTARARNIWRTSLDWKVPLRLQKPLGWLTGGADARWSAFSLRYHIFLAALCLAFAAVPAWHLCDFFYQSWRMDTALFLEQATQIQGNLRYEYLLNQKNELVKPPYEPSMFDAIKGRWQRGIHPHRKDNCQKDCSFGYFHVDGLSSEAGLAHLIWPSTAAESILTNLKESRRRVSSAEASSLLRRFKNWMVPGHPVPLMIAALGAERIERGIKQGPAPWEAVYGKYRRVAYQLPLPRELSQLSANAQDVHAPLWLAPFGPLFGILALFGLFRLLDAQLFGSWLLWSGRLGPSGPPRAECAHDNHRFKLMVRASQQCREEISCDCRSKGSGLYEIDIGHHLDIMPFPDAPVWVDGLDVVIRADAKHRQYLLSVLEEFVARPGERCLWIATDSPPLHYISRPEAYPESASPEEPLCLSERLRWARLFSLFAKCYPLLCQDDLCASLRLEARKSDAKMAELIDRETRLFWPEMLGLRGWLMARCARPAQTDRPLNERDVIEAVEMEYGAMMRRYWESLTTQERLLMKQLADGNYANPGNRLALLHLLRRGLLVSEPCLMVKTEALRLFVQTAETQEQFEVWQAQTPVSAWQRFKAPILIGLVLLLGITGWVTRDATQLITSLLGALTGALSLFGRAVGGGKIDSPR